MTIECINKGNLKNGKELILRKPIKEDAKNIIEYLNIVGGESDNLLFGAGEVTLSVGDEISFIESINKDNNSLMIIGLIDNEIVSVAQISSPNRKRIAHNSEIAISVKEKYWSIGVGSAVMGQLIKFASDSGVIKNIILGVNSANDKAIKLYEKFGFKNVGVHKNYFNINGKYYDEIIMDLYI
ncbi:MAG: GNAT family protein [Clostridium sp.]|uniref:GNAT family N-acetyltransferase n=1 Tax=Clostridium sp. TaxID=1506 RepID=UPI00290C09DE|nr:GNAT family protein [Clostridium sp.]MDU5111846.1 GNAT family protein [Clostridium sp.]